MADLGKREGNDAPIQAEHAAGFLTWAATQPIRFGLVDGHPVRLAEQHQGEGRLTLACGLAERAFGSAETAKAWLAFPRRT